MGQQPYDSTISTDISDAELEALIKARANEAREAYTKLYKRYEPTVRKRLVNLLALIPDREGVVDELCQEIFTTVWVGLPAKKEKSPFKSWLQTVARHEAIDYLRHWKILEFVQLPEDEWEEGEDQPYTGGPLQAPGTGPEQQACEVESYEELLALIEQILGQMRSKYARMCATLCIVWGCSQQEVADALHIDKKRVSEYVCHGRALLRRDLGHLKSKISTERRGGLSL